MRLGAHLPLLDLDGAGWRPDTVASYAAAARRLGYASVCGNDHLVFPACSVPTSHVAVTWPYVDRSGCSVVLVKDTAEELSSSCRRVYGDNRGRVKVGRVLVETLVWTVAIEMPFVKGERGTGG